MNQNGIRIDLEEARDCKRTGRIRTRTNKTTDRIGTGIIRRRDRMELKQTREEQNNQEKGKNKN